MANLMIELRELSLMNHSTLAETRLQKILPYYLVMIFMITIVGALMNYKNHDPWRIGDWLIHYAGGFVRRGFSGELFVILSNTFSVNPAVFVVLTQLTLYAIFFYFCYRLLKNVDLLKYAILVISPFIFTFQITTFDGGYRKEVIYFAVLSVLAFAKVNYHQATFEKIFILSLPLFAFAILSHELLAVFVPYLLVLYALNNTLTVKKYILLAVLCVPLLISMVLAIYYKGSAAHEVLITDALARLGYEVERGALRALTYSMEHSLSRVLEEIKQNYTAYLAVIALSLLAFIPVQDGLRALLKNKPIAFFILSSLFGTMIVALFALDWGRFLYIHLVSWFIILLVFDNLNPVAKNSQWPSGFIITLIIIWAVMFHIPHCCIKSCFIAQQISDMNYFYQAFQIIDKL
jgi:hypothetical protein